MSQESKDTEILELSLKALSARFDMFIDECMVDGKPVQPSMGAVMKARSFLPPDYKHAYTKR